jgi:hypothetical protein
MQACRPQNSSKGKYAPAKTTQGRGEDQIKIESKSSGRYSFIASTRTSSLFLRVGLIE